VSDIALNKLRPTPFPCTDPSTAFIKGKDAVNNCDKLTAAELRFDPIANWNVNALANEPGSVGLLIFCIRRSAVSLNSLSLIPLTACFNPL
jgi:hypothetical protein